MFQSVSSHFVKIPEATRNLVSLYLPWFSQQPNRQQETQQVRGQSAENGPEARLRFHPFPPSLALKCAHAREGESSVMNLNKRGIIELRGNFIYSYPFALFTDTPIVQKLLL